MNYLELLEREGIPHKTSGHHHCQVGWVQTDCPECSPTWHHFRLGFNLRFGYFNCWACGRMPLFPTFRKLFPDLDVKEFIADLTTSPLPEVPEVPRGIYLPPKGLTKLEKQHRAYLEKRGYDPDILEEVWGLKGLSLSPSHAWRIFIPIYHKREPVSWTTRSLADGIKSKYLTAKPQEEKVDHHAILYGADFCTNACVVVEGPFDAWKIGPGAVATFGTGFSVKQLARLAKFSVRAVCFDNDGPGRKRAKELVDFLSCLPGTTYAVKLDSKDAGSASKRELARIREILA